MINVNESQTLQDVALRYMAPIENKETTKTEVWMELCGALCCCPSAKFKGVHRTHPETRRSLRRMNSNCDHFPMCQHHVKHNSFQSRRDGLHYVAWNVPALSPQPVVHLLLFLEQKVIRFSVGCRSIYSAASTSLSLPGSDGLPVRTLTRIFSWHIYSSSTRKHAQYLSAGLK